MTGRRTLPLLALIIALASARSFAQSPGNDIVELFNGQIFHGSLIDPTLTIDSGLGSLQFPIERISTVVSLPAPRFQQTVTLRNGDVLIGRVQAKTIHLKDAAGAASEMQLSQISRISTEVRGAPPSTNQAPNTATVFSLAGDRLTILTPGPITFRSRWGDLSVTGDLLRQLILVDKNQPAHRLFLSDGSSISGLLIQPAIDLHPVDSPSQTLSTTIGQIAKIVSTSPETPHAAPRLDMTGGDALRAAMQGSLSLQTQFGPVSIGADDIEKLSPDPDSPGDVSVTSRDGRTLKGAPQDGSIAIKLDCGLAFSVPASLIADYARTAPASTASAAPAPDDALANADPAMLAQVQACLKQMAGNNVQVRQRAHNQLVGMGKPVVPILTQLRAEQPRNIQTQIDAILARIPQDPQ
jgi:hypothetical protein